MLNESSILGIDHMTIQLEYG